MKNLEIYPEILFKDEVIIDSRLGHFADLHLVAITEENTSGQFDDMIAALTPILTAFNVSIAGKASSLGSRKVATLTVDQYINQYQALVRTAEATVLTLCTKKDPVYADFFPKPLRKYTEALRNDIGENIDHFIAKFTAHTEYGLTMKTAFTTLKNSYLPAKSTQATNKVKVKEAISEESEERIALEKQLTLDVLNIAVMYIGKPDKMKIFFDTSLLYFHAHDMFIPGVVREFKFKALQTKNSKIEGLVDTIVRLINSGTTRLQFWTASSTKNPTPPEKSTTLEPGGDITTPMKEISGSETDKYLFIRNLDAAAGDGSVEITGTTKPV